MTATENPIRWTHDQVDHARAMKIRTFVLMPAMDFLELTTTSKEMYPTVDDLLHDAGELEDYNRASSEGKIRIAPFLRIGKKGRVTGHEGRHRAAALINDEGSEAEMVAGVLTNEDPLPLFWYGEFVKSRQIYAGGYPRFTADELREVISSYRSNPTSLKVKLTNIQAEWIEWALDAMIDVAVEEVEEEDDYTEDEIPVLDGNTLDLSEASDAAIQDLLWRLDNLLPDMIESEFADSPGAVASKLRSVELLADKIRKATGD